MAPGLGSESSAAYLGEGCFLEARSHDGPQAGPTGSGDPLASGPPRHGGRRLDCSALGYSVGTWSSNTPG